MKKLLYCLSLFVLSAGPVEGLLAPFEQSAVEIKKIVDSDELRNLLGPSQPIQGIERNDQGYIITSSDYTLQVDLNYQYSGRIGPAEFQLKFEKPVKK